jgi:hypothetical protein
MKPIMLVFHQVEHMFKKQIWNSLGIIEEWNSSSYEPKAKGPPNPQHTETITIQKHIKARIFGIISFYLAQTGWQEK